MRRKIGKVVALKKTRESLETWEDENWSDMAARIQPGGYTSDRSSRAAENSESCDRLFGFISAAFDHVVETLPEAGRFSPSVTGYCPAPSL